MKARRGKYLKYIFQAKLIKVSIFIIKIENKEARKRSTHEFLLFIGENKQFYFKTKIELNKR